MKKLILLNLIFVLTGCGSPEKPKPQPISAQKSTNMEIFSNTRNWEESEVLASASIALSRGVSLNATRAERCWREEANRPTIREACLLLWATGDEASSVLAEILLEPGTRRIALAAYLRRSSLRSMGFTQLMKLLSALATDSLWLRAEAVELWVQFHGRPSYGETQQLLPLIEIGPGDGLRSTSASLKAKFLLSPGSWQKALQLYCRSNAKGESRLRCWKILGAIADPSQDSLMRSEIETYLPSNRENDWVLFERSFPQLAQKIKKHYRKELR